MGCSTGSRGSGCVGAAGPGQRWFNTDNDWLIVLARLSDWLSAYRPMDCLTCCAAAAWHCVTRVLLCEHWFTLQVSNKYICASNWQGGWASTLLGEWVSEWASEWRRKRVASVSKGSRARRLQEPSTSHVHG